ncbi:ORF939 [White spot syndrome virus]|uniref:ORF939 n=1 Tax=White spot syndrome virus TaxID=342409 RepID=A0A2D3I6V0_9VIRU|nr:ORF939 [White spot syndrome virus]
MLSKTLIAIFILSDSFEKFCCKLLIFEITCSLSISSSLSVSLMAHEEACLVSDTIFVLMASISW